MVVSVTGLGWFGPKGPGTGREDRFHLHEGAILKVPRRSVFPAPYTHFGRMDVYSKIGVSAVALALRDAGLEYWKDRRNFGLVSSTLYGCLATDIEFYDTAKEGSGGLASPQLFAYTLSNTFVGEAAIRFGLTGPTYSINEQPLTGIEALKNALLSIFLGEADTMIAGVCDLGRPNRFPSEGSDTPVALFAVLERAPTKRDFSHGETTLDGTCVICDGKNIDSIFTLAEILTSGGRQ
jgi:3-oxoacyl-[acyl-carrier-protein] synthase II